MAIVYGELFMDLKNIKSRIFRKEHRVDNPRVKIQNFHEIHLLIGEDKYDVYNISLAGLAFLETNQKKFNKGEKLNVVVKILGQVCDIEIEVRHHTKDIVGCLVIGSCDVYKEFVEDYFTSEIEALNLRKIGREKLADDDNGEPHWLYGDYNHEIYYTTDDESNITTVQINYHGYMFISDHGKTSTGQVWTDEKEGDISHKSADLVKESQALPMGMMEFMYRFVQSADLLDSKHKKQILQKLKDRFDIDWNV